VNREHASPGPPTGDRLYLLSKSGGRTSRAVVDLLVRRLRRRDVGHAGTLDPFATGLLLVAVGRATRLVPWIHEWSKEYRARVRLGIGTDSLDRTGVVTATAPVPADALERLPAALESLTGIIDQAPPMVSAARVGGERLHALARRGLEVPRESRRREVHEIEVERVAVPDVDLRVVCSTGTYIRVLAQDLGERLGVPAHLAELERTRIGPFRLDRTLPDIDVPGSGDDTLARHAVELPDILPDWPAHTAGDEERRDIRHGRIPAAWSEALSGAPAPARYRILGDDGRLLALVERGDPDSPPRYLRVFAAEDES
jgi:tRNA pseudouridine55 synthase